MAEKETCPKALENTHNKKHRVYTGQHQNSTMKKRYVNEVINLAI